MKKGLGVNKVLKLHAAVLITPASLTFRVTFINHECFMYSINFFDENKSLCIIFALRGGKNESVWRCKLLLWSCLKRKIKSRTEGNHSITRIKVDIYQTQPVFSRLN